MKTETTTLCEPCPNCGQVNRLEELRPIKDLHQRVDPGEPMPAGECPDCGALCHEKDAGVTAAAAIFNELKRTRAERDALRGALQALHDQIAQADEDWFSEECEGFNLEPARAALALVKEGAPLKVIVEVSGGCADVTSWPPGVEVEIVDNDNERDTI